MVQTIRRSMMSDHSLLLIIGLARDTSVPSSLHLMRSFEVALHSVHTNFPWSRYVILLAARVVSSVFEFRMKRMHALDP